MKKFIWIKLKLTALIAISSLTLGACSNPFDALADQINAFISDENEETGGDEEDNYTTDHSDTVHSENSDESTERFDYESLRGEGEESTLEEGEYKVGEDIEEGRYQVTPSNGSGNFSVTSENNDKQVNHVSMTLSSEGGHTPEEAVIYLFEGYELMIYTPANLKFTPFNEEVSVDELSAGQYIIGEDFEPGIYEIHSSITEGYFSIDVYNGTYQEQSASFQLGDPVYGGAEHHLTSFESGDIIVVHAPAVELIMQE